MFANRLNALARKLSGIALLGAASAGLAGMADAQTAPGPVLTPAPAQMRNYAPGTLIIPDSNRLAATDGKKMRTHLRAIVVSAAQAAQGAAGAPASGGATPNVYGPPIGGYFYETPASIQCVYGLVAVVAGCSPTAATAHLTTGGARAIAIVDAGHYVTAKSDLAVFSAQFGLPAPTASNFAIKWVGATRPPINSGTGWDIEAALDIQWARAMAPNAFIYLVEAQSAYDSDMFAAVDLASQLVAAKGGGEVSMSWGRVEDFVDPGLNAHMTRSTVVYFASSGDAPGVEYPCASPNVVCVGGTSVSRSRTTGAFQGEVAWGETGGGISAYQRRPGYQNAISSIVGAKRGVPDISAVADPYTGVWVFNSTYGWPGWYSVGGTSVAAPLMAGFVNHAGTFRTSSAAENAAIYSTLGVPGLGWTDIASGACNIYRSDLAVAGWDACTGRGSPFGNSYRGVFSAAGR